jgi:ABC-type transporter Mla maintaining outer membrane lipid asymmetry ATPase subunit MlaF
MPEPILALEGVTLRAPDGHRLFHGLDWQVPRGARFHLKNVRGGGATAFLRLCAGIAEPEAGRVRLDGAALAAPHLRHPFLERGALGFVPSDGGLAVNLPILDNIALPLRFALNLGRAEAEAQARLWLDRAGLAEVAHARPRVPADGQSWLAALASAAAKAAELWLVDRPAGGLDPDSRRAAREILAQTGADPAVTMILVGEDWLADLGRPLAIVDSRMITEGQP